MKKPMSKVDELREALKVKKETEASCKKTTEESVPHSAEEKVVPDEATREEENILAELHTAEKEAKEHYDKLLRTMAEFENFKRRMSREQENSVKFANERLIFDLLPVLDDLDRSIEHAIKDDTVNQTLVEALNLVRKTMFGTLQKFGLSEIEIQGAKFDPAIHDAVSCIESNEHEDGSIIEVGRKGYKLYDRVIRAAQVVVTKKPVIRDS